MSKAVEIIDGVLFVHTRHYDDVNRVIICNQKKPYRVFSDDAKKEWSRPHGKWIEHRQLNPVGCLYSEYECSVCHDEVWQKTEWQFCPNCGASMDKEEGD